MSKKQTYARIAPFYDFLDASFEHKRYMPIREEMWQGVEGKVLDAGVGTGRNIPYYPKQANGPVIGIDLCPQMLAKAKARKVEVGAEVDLFEMNVMATDYPDNHFDNVVATFLFCVLEDEDQCPALRELQRITKPDGEIRILEYAISEDPWRRFVQKLWAPWVSFAYGARFDRDTEQYLGDTCLELVERRFVYEDMIKLLILKPNK